MTYTTHVLVVANVTATAPELLDALRRRAERGPISLMLLMPATEPGLTGREACQERLERVLERWREEGLEATGVVGDDDPVEAVTEIWRPDRFDEIIVSTLPAETSRWLRVDLPRRIARLTDAQVDHVVSTPPRRRFPAHHEPPSKPHPLGPLAPLAWGGRRGDA